MDVDNKEKTLSGDANCSVIDTSVLDVSTIQDDTLNYQTADEENSSKYFSMIEGDSTLEGTSSIDVTLDNKSDIQDESSVSCETKASLLDSLNSFRSEAVNKLQIHERIDAAKILSGGVDIFDDNENSVDEPELVIDDDPQFAEKFDDCADESSGGATADKDEALNVPVEKTSHVPVPQVEEEVKDVGLSEPLILCQGEETVLVKEVVDDNDLKGDNYSALLQSNLPEGSSEVTLLIDDKNVDAIGIGDGVFIYKNDEGELTAIQITMNEDGTTNFKCLHVGKNEDGNLEVYEEQVNQIPVTTEELESMKSQTISSEATEISKEVLNSDLKGDNPKDEISVKSDTVIPDLDAKLSCKTIHVSDDKIKSEISIDTKKYAKDCIVESVKVESDSVKSSELVTSVDPVSKLTEVVSLPGDDFKISNSELTLSTDLGQVHEMSNDANKEAKTLESDKILLEEQVVCASQSNLDTEVSDKNEENMNEPLTESKECEVLENKVDSDLPSNLCDLPQSNLDTEVRDKNLEKNESLAESKEYEVLENKVDSDVPQLNLDTEVSDKNVKSMNELLTESKKCETLENKVESDLPQSNLDTEVSDKNVENMNELLTESKECETLENKVESDLPQSNLDTEVSDKNLKNMDESSTETKECETLENKVESDLPQSNLDTEVSDKNVENMNEPLTESKESEVLENEVDSDLSSNLCDEISLISDKSDQPIVTSDSDLKIMCSEENIKSDTKGVDVENTGDSTEDLKIKMDCEQNKTSDTKDISKSIEEFKNDQVISSSIVEIPPNTKINEQCLVESVIPVILERNASTTEKIIKRNEEESLNKLTNSFSLDNVISQDSANSLSGVVLLEPVNSDTSVISIDVKNVSEVKDNKDTASCVSEIKDNIELHSVDKESVTCEKITKVLDVEINEFSKTNIANMTHVSKVGSVHDNFVEATNDVVVEEISDGVVEEVHDNLVKTVVEINDEVVNDKSDKTINEVVIEKNNDDEVEDVNVNLNEYINVDEESIDVEDEINLEQKFSEENQIEILEKSESKVEAYVKKESKIKDLSISDDNKVVDVEESDESQSLLIVNEKNNLNQVNEIESKKDISDAGNELLDAPDTSVSQKTQDIGKCKNIGLDEEFVEQKLVTPTKTTQSKDISIKRLESQSSVDSEDDLDEDDFVEGEPVTGDIGVDWLQKTNESLNIQKEDAKDREVNYDTVDHKKCSTITIEENVQITESVNSSAITIEESVQITECVENETRKDSKEFCLKNKIVTNVLDNNNDIKEKKSIPVEVENTKDKVLESENKSIIIEEVDFDKFVRRNSVQLFEECIQVDYEDVTETVRTKSVPVVEAENNFNETFVEKSDTGVKILSHIVIHSETSPKETVSQPYKDSQSHSPKNLHTKSNYKGLENNQLHSYAPSFASIDNKIHHNMNKMSQKPDVEKINRSPSHYNSKLHTASNVYKGFNKTSPTLLQRPEQKVNYVMQVNDNNKSGFSITSSSHVKSPVTVKSNPVEIHSNDHNVMESKEQSISPEKVNIDNDSKISTECDSVSSADESVPHSEQSQQTKSRQPRKQVFTPVTRSDMEIIFPNLYSNAEVYKKESEAKALKLSSKLKERDIRFKQLSKKESPKRPISKDMKILEKTSPPLERNLKMPDKEKDKVLESPPKQGLNESPNTYNFLKSKEIKVSPNLSLVPPSDFTPIPVPEETVSITLPEEPCKKVSPELNTAPEICEKIIEKCIKPVLTCPENKNLEIKTIVTDDTSKVINSEIVSDTNSDNLLSDKLVNKIIATTISDSPAMDTSMTISPKRKRGRPKKNLSDSPDVSLSKENAQKKESPVLKKDIKKKESPVKVITKADEIKRASSISPFGKINENIKCPICFKTFRTENVLLKHVKHCNGVLSAEIISSPKKRKITDNESKSDNDTSMEVSNLNESSKFDNDQSIEINCDKKDSKKRDEILDISTKTIDEEKKIVESTTEILSPENLNSHKKIDQQLSTCNKDYDLPKEYYQTVTPKKSVETIPSETITEVSPVTTKCVSSPNKKPDITISKEVSQSSTEPITLEDSFTDISTLTETKNLTEEKKNKKIINSEVTCKPENISDKKLNIVRKNKNMSDKMLKCKTESTKKTANKSMASPMSRLSKFLNTKPPMNNPITCEICGKTFRQLAHMVYHRTKHHSEETSLPNTANSLNTSVESIPIIVEDTPEVSESDAILKCEICQKGFRKLHHLVEHREVHLNSETKSRRTSVASVKSEPEAGFRCDTCDKSFRKLHHLVEHRELHINELVEPAPQSQVPSDTKSNEDATCPGCGKSFRKRFHMVEHRDIHCSPSKKNKADQESTTESNIRLSTASSTSDEGNNCGICGKSYRKLHHMVEHRESHSEIREEKTKTKTFSETEHLSTKDIIHECPKCYMVFPNENSLNKHVTICSRKKKINKSFSFNLDQDNADLSDINIISEKKLDEEKSNPAIETTPIVLNIEETIDITNEVVPKSADVSSTDEKQLPIDNVSTPTVTEPSSKTDLESVEKYSLEELSKLSEISNPKQKAEIKKLPQNSEHQKELPKPQDKRKSISKVKKSIVKSQSLTKVDKSGVASKVPSLRKSSVSTDSSIASRSTPKRKSTSSIDSRENLPIKRSIMSKEITGDKLKVSNKKPSNIQNASKKVSNVKLANIKKVISKPSPRRYSYQGSTKVEDDSKIKYKLSTQTEVKYKINPEFSKPNRRLSQPSESKQLHSQIDKPKVRRSDSALTGLKIPNAKMLQTILEETTIRYSFPKTPKAKRKSTDTNNKLNVSQSSSKKVIPKQTTSVVPKKSTDNAETSLKSKKIVTTKNTTLLAASKRKSLGGRKSLDGKKLPGLPKKLQLRCCGQIFNSQVNLAVHRKTHKVDKVHKCDCGKVFDGEIFLKRHIDTEHTPPKSYKCQQCGASVRTAAQFAKHRKDHQAVAPSTSTSHQTDSKRVQGTKKPKVKTPEGEVRKGVKRKVAHGGVPLSDKMRKAMAGIKF